MTTHDENRGNGNTAAFTSVVLLVTFGLILTLLLISSGTAKTGEQAVALRATFAPTLVPPSPTVAATAIPPTSAPVVAAVSFDPKAIAAGQDVFSSTCFACHGMTAKGIPGLGKDLIESAFVHGLTDQELVAFIAHGRDVSDRANTTGVAMPARGGNPALTDVQLADVVTYIRSLTAKENGAASAPAAPTQPPAPSDTTNETPFVLPIDSVLGSSGDASATEASFVLPIDAVLQPSNADSTASAAPATVAPTSVPSTAPTLRSTPDETEVPFALPIDSVLTPSGS